MALLVTTLEHSGIDRYSLELAKRIEVPTLETKRYLRLKDALKLVRRLKEASPPIHLPSQHFARYALFLGKPYIITVHDLVRLCFPFTDETLGEKVGLKLDILGLKRAEHIIAVSSCTKEDLMRYLGIPESRISVIYNGVDRSIFKPVDRKIFDFPYLLYVGTERPRKNLATLLFAFALLKRDGMLKNYKLVKVGDAGRSDKFRQATLEEIRRLELWDDVIFVEHVPDRELATYYSSALALVMPSFYEGFGLPLLEAMACGCPVICSNTSSLPEVAGEAALLFPPHDAKELASKIKLLLTEPSIRNKLIQKGFERIEHFSWEKAARQTSLLYRRVEARLGLKPKESEAPLRRVSPAGLPTIRTEKASLPFQSGDKRV